MKTHKLLTFFLGFVAGLAFLVLSQNIVSHAVQYRPVNFDVDTLIGSIQKGIQGNSIDYTQFDQVYDVLESSYYDTGVIDSGTMRVNALKSFVNALDDPYTVYLDSEENTQLQEMLQGQQDFEGIGAVVTKKDEGVLIQEVLKGSPAFLAGLKPLDVIVKVDDTNVVPMSLADAIEIIRGPKGSTVLLTILRTDDGSQEILEIEVIRDAIEVPSATSEVITRGNKNYGYITLSVIGEETEEILRKEISVLKSSSLDGIIIDLRGNGGGILGTAVAIVSHFVEEGQLVVSAKYRTLQDEEFYSKGGKDFGDLPIVVLIDGMTASAGEIIALALRDLAGATLVGTTSFGKGSIQTIEYFIDASSLKYTIGKWFSPKGDNVDETGVVPDIEVQFDQETFLSSGEDNQLEKAIEIFQ